VLVRPFVWACRVNRSDFIDFFSGAVARAMEACHRALSLTQTGRVRHYATGIAIGAVVVIGIVVLT
jgi:NADH-quinone oxidoreductase subunit L